MAATAAQEWDGSREIRAEYSIMEKNRLWSQGDLGMLVRMGKVGKGRLQLPPAGKLGRMA